MIKLYGVAASRALRCLWMLEEVGVDYELVPTNFTEDNKTPEYRKLNPNGRVPTLIDGETVLWESLAINFYLAAKYDAGMKPPSAELLGHAYQWSFWAMTEVEPYLLDYMLHRSIFPEGQRDHKVADAAWKSLQGPLGILDDVLRGRTHLVGDSFTVGDLNPAAVLSWLHLAKADLSQWEHLSTWLDTCLARPAMARARKK